MRLSHTGRRSVARTVASPSRNIFRNASTRGESPERASAAIDTQGAMEWLALDARLEQKKKAKIRRQQRELKKLQREREEREKQQRMLNQRCIEMRHEELLSIAMERFYRQEADRKRLETKREEDMQVYRDVNKARKRAQELGLPVSTPGISGIERLHELETRIADNEEAMKRASMAKHRLDALPKKKASRRKMMTAYFTSSLQKKIERAVYDQACDHLLSLFEPESHTTENRAKSLLNHESANGFTPVLATIVCSKQSVLRRLLEIGASPDFETTWGMTPLVASIMADDIVAMSILMELKVEINYETRHGVRALHVAADKGRLELMKVLLRGDADVNAVSSKKGRSALMQAVLSNHFEAVKILIAFGADKLLKDEISLTAAEYAHKLKLPHIVSLLSSSVSSASLLAQIVEDEDEANQDGYSMTMTSAGRLTYQRRTAMLESAMKTRDVARLRQLLEDPTYSANHEDARGNTPFLVMCEVGSCNDILFCLDKNAIPTHQNCSGVNGLMAASYRGDLEMLELLIKAGCNLRTRDFKGWDCYRYLNQHDHLDVVEKLTKVYRGAKAAESPGFVLENPPANTKELRSRKPGLPSSARSIALENTCRSPEGASNVELELGGTGRSTERTICDRSRDGEDDDYTSGDSSESDDFTDPTQDPAIRKWHTRQQVLKHNRARCVDLDHERDQILLTAKRGRRNGLIAPLPGDPTGRKKLPVCKNCKGCRARKRCVECEQVLCDKCYARLHELAQRRHHRFEELQPQVYVGHELKQVVQEREANSLGHCIESSTEQVALMHKLLRSDAVFNNNRHSIATPSNNAEDPEVDKFKRKKRVAREKEIMQLQINVPMASAKYAAREGEGEIFTNPAEIELANLYILQKKCEKAKELLLQTQKLVQESLGVLHPTMLKISIGLARVYQVRSSRYCELACALSVYVTDPPAAYTQETGYHDLSVQTMKDSLALFESVLSPDHKDVLLGVSVMLTGLVRL